jgi:hypothetical protein
MKKTEEKSPTKNLKKPSTALVNDINMMKFGKEIDQAMNLITETFDINQIGFREGIYAMIVLLAANFKTYEDFEQFLDSIKISFRHAFKE